MKTSNNNFYNPEAEFRPMDFSLWAHPEEGGAIQEEEKSALAPTSTSPVMNPTAAAARPNVNIGGITAPAPQAAPLPQQGAGGTASRTSTAVNPDQSFGGKLHDKLRNVLTGEAPQGYESILSPEEINAARPTLSQSIFLGDDNPGSGGAWKRNLDKLVATKQQSAGIVANQGVQAATSKIFADNPPPKNGTPEEMGKWANTVVPALAAAGNYGAVEKLAPFAKLFDKPGTKKNNQQVQAGDMVTSYDPEKGFYDPRPDSPTYGQWVMGISRGVPAATVAHNKANENLAQERINVQLGRLAQNGVKIERSSLESGLKEFNTATAPAVKRAPIIEQAIFTLDQAAHSPDANMRKTLYSSSVANFVQAADQNAQLRIQLLHYFQTNVDKSVAGQWNILRDRMIKGELPGYSLEAMLKHIKELRKLEVENITAHRDGINKRRPYMGEALPTPDEYFPSLKQEAPANDAASMFGVTPLRKP